MTENTEQTEDTRSAEQVEIDRLTAECAVWRDRNERVNKEYARYRKDMREFTKQADQTIENLNSRIAAQNEHLSVHHQQDAARAAEMEQMEAKLTSYSALLNLMADAGRLPIEMLEHIDAGISAIHDNTTGGSMPQMEVADVKFFTGKNPLQQLRDYLAESVAKNGGKVEFDENGIPQVTIEDDDDTEYVTPRDLATEVKAESGPAYSEGPDMERVSYTDAGLPKRPVQDKPQPGNDWADDDPEAPWNQ